MNTEHLYDRRKGAQDQLDAIQTASRKAYIMIEAVARLLQLETGCSEKDVDLLMDHVSDGLSDMLDDVITRWTTERDEADDAIGNIEEAHLRRSAPVTL